MMPKLLPEHVVHVKTYLGIPQPIRQGVMATLQKRRLGYHLQMGLEPGFSGFLTLHIDHYCDYAIRGIVIMLCRHHFSGAWSKSSEFPTRYISTLECVVHIVLQNVEYAYLYLQHAIWAFTNSLAMEILTGSRMFAHSGQMAQGPKAQAESRATDSSGISDNGDKKCSAHSQS
jgi:hypothetical protein